MTVAEWTLLYLATGLAFLAWSWHTKRVVESAAQELPGAGVATFALALLLAIQLPLWPLVGGVQFIERVIGGPRR